MRHWIIGLVGILLLLGCADTKEQDVVATVADREISVSKVTDYYNEYMVTYLPSAEEELRLKQEYLDSLIADELLAVSAYVHGLDRDIEILELVEAERGKFLLDELYRVEISEKCPVTDEEIQEWYDHYFTRLRGRHLLVATREEADSLRAELRAGANFAELASTHSLDPLTRRRGGDMGKYYRWGDLVPSFQRAFFALGDDTVSAPVETDYGWHLIEVLDRKTIDRRPLDSVRENIAQAIKAIKVKDREIEHRLEVRERYPITIDEDGRALLIKKIKEYAKIDTAEVPDSLRRDVPLDYLSSFEQDQPFATYLDDRTLTVGEYLTITNNVRPERKPALDDDQRLKVFMFEELLYEFLLAEAHRLNLEESEVYQKRIKRFTETLMVDKMRNSVIVRDASVTESEMKDYFEAHRDSFYTDLKLRVREILVYTEETADSLYRQLQQGADFAQLARERTTRKGYQRPGGDLGYLKPYRREKIWERASQMKVGEISEPFLTKDDWSIIKLEERIEPEPRPYDSVKIELFNTLQGRELETLREKYIDSLRAVTPVTVDTELLKSTIDYDRYAEKDQ